MADNDKKSVNEVWGAKVGDISDNDMIRAAKIAGVESDGSKEDLAAQIADYDRPPDFLFEHEIEEQREEKREEVEAALSKK